MGLDAAAVKFLCAAKSLGVDFSHTLMVGRQQFFLPDAGPLRQVFKTLGIEADPEAFLRDNVYGEALFRLLGAKEISSLDVSSYEGATIIHDLNAPIPPDQHRRFSAVFDGGTLEHVFNVPQALKSCMQMVQVGGHLLQVSVANNFMGHGFWQFTPELVFRALGSSNGFRIEAVLLHEVISRGAWYAVSDPDTVRSRVELCNARPTYILAIAKRIADVEMFSTPPCQSDYVAEWERHRVSSTSESNESPHGVSSSKSILSRYLPKPLFRVLKYVHGRLTSGKPRGRKLTDHGFDQAFYKQIGEDALLNGKF
jgi:hypothetical protein